MLTNQPTTTLSSLILPHHHFKLWNSWHSAYCLKYDGVWLLIYENHIKKYMIKTILFKRCFRYPQIQTQRLSIHLLTTVICTHAQYSWTSYCSHKSHRRIYIYIYIYTSLLGITLLSVDLIFLFSHFDTVRYYNGQF